uniref:ubiquitinyl hydrolase 1 n=2 Tax=Physcomitrium patens TaxID=3218 RepID=A0A2K1KAY9_PHYPA|nr:ataxin-3 homolog [Physcomitrium patens]PNR50945.1 hypothetical protein PHYPA_010131 [Physcomitrium patens]|eukprot:XP_024379753.1 ataxin-3 homolog [Physcomitrella patens]
MAEGSEGVGGGGGGSRGGGGGDSLAMTPSLLYHEVQESRLCAVHCVNAVLQGPYFSEVDLGTMAQELDKQEEQVMLESGSRSSHYLNYKAEGSSNVDADGNFSIQVLNRALQIWNLQCVPLEAPEAADARTDPQKQSAFICHLQAHWFCIRRVGERWYNFNSLYPAPEYLSNFYLAAYLDTLKMSGWSIFVVRGSLPNSACWGNEDKVGVWLTPEEADRITRAAKDSTQADKSKASPAGTTQKNPDSKICPANLAAALASSLGTPQRTSSISFSDQDADESADYAAAIAASLADIKPPSIPGQQRDQQQSQQGVPDAAVLAQALASSLFNAARASGVNLPAPRPPPKD